MTGLDALLQHIIIAGLNKRSRLPRLQTLAVGKCPLVRRQLTLGTILLLLLLHQIVIIPFTHYCCNCCHLVMSMSAQCNGWFTCSPGSTIIFYYCRTSLDYYITSCVIVIIIFKDISHLFSGPWWDKESIIHLWALHGYWINDVRCSDNITWFSLPYPLILFLKHLLLLSWNINCCRIWWGSSPLPGASRVSLETTFNSKQSMLPELCIFISN